MKGYDCHFDHHPTNDPMMLDQIDEGLKLQFDDLERLGSAIGEMGIQVLFVFVFVFICLYLFVFVCIC